MHILLSNDDGIQSLGIDELSIALSKHWRVTIIAPDRERSGNSHALTINKPLRLTELPSYKENIQRFSFSGTPVDCVKFGIEYYLKDDMPDLIISGINNGYNLGSDALYSGTVAAAMEGCLYGIPAIALSVKRYSSKRGREIIPFIIEFVEEVFVNQQFKGLINMNFPLVGPVDWKHVKAVPQGIQRYKNVINAQDDGKGNIYYWLSGEYDFSGEASMNDVDIIEKGFITLTSLTWNQCDLSGQETLKRVVTEKNDK